MPTKKKKVNIIKIDVVNKEAFEIECPEILISEKDIWQSEHPKRTYTLGKGM